MDSKTRIVLEPDVWFIWECDDCKGWGKVQNPITGEYGDMCGMCGGMGDIEHDPVSWTWVCRWLL